MKITSIDVVGGTKGGLGGGQNEKQEVRTARMKNEFFGNKANDVLMPIGSLLASTTKDASGKATTLAALIAAGETLELPEIRVQGATLPLADGFSISLANMVGTWACPACKSAHGSGVYPSRAVDADILARNKFYYRPADRTVFVISDTCKATYVKDLGFETAARFVAPKSPTKKA